MEIEVKEIAFSDKREIKKFIAFPYELYEDSKFWVPPMQSDMLTVFNRKKHPFYEHSEACFFSAQKNGEVFGQLAVLNNKVYNAFHHTETAFFYFFEAVNNTRIAQKLFGAAEVWAKNQGLKQITGPLGFHALDGRGILVEGFDILPATGIPYNHEYYGSLIESAGLKKKTDFKSGTFDKIEFPEWFESIRKRAARRYWVKSFADKGELLEWVEPIRNIYNEAFTELDDHYPLSQAEMNFAVKHLLDVADPRLIKIMMSGDSPVGFILVYPNIVKGIQKARGKLLPLGWWRLLREIKKTGIVDLNGVATLKNFRESGGNVVLYAELKKSLEEFGFERGEVVQIEEDNYKSLGEVGFLDINWRKKHRVYQKNI
jgi:hypothetical protein